MSFVAATATHFVNYTACSGRAIHACVCDKERRPVCLAQYIHGRRHCVIEKANWDNSAEGLACDHVYGPSVAVNLFRLSEIYSHLLADAFLCEHTHRGTEGATVLIQQHKADGQYVVRLNTHKHLAYMQASSTSTPITRVSCSSLET